MRECHIPSKGIVYSATGDRCLTEAITSAQSSLRFNHLPHLIFCDQAPPVNIEGIEFRQFRKSNDPFLDKVRNIATIPFEQTIYLEAS